jgi:D-sedoheptulose 7-phosphate isomerase
MTYTQQHVAETVDVLNRLDQNAIETLVAALVELRSRGGRLFIVGVGGSAGNASHAVNDFRKLAEIETYTPTDNVSELTARANDEGWETTFEAWLKGSRLSKIDGVLCLSVGGGSKERNISMNIVRALEYSKQVGATIMGIVGRDGGATKELGDAVVLVPVVNDLTVTPHSESMQSVILHLLVSHPKLKANPTKW